MILRRYGKPEEYGAYHYMRAVHCFDPAYGVRFTTYVGAAMNKIGANGLYVRKRLIDYDYEFDIDTLYYERSPVADDLLDIFDERRYDIMRMRAEGYTFREIGAAHDISHERVRQIWSGCLSTLRRLA